MYLILMLQQISINWNAISAIGEWAGAVFTAFAVWIALYSSRNEQNSNVKVVVSNGFLTRGNQISDLFLLCKSINIGLNTVTIESFSIKIPGEKNQIIFPELVNGILPALLNRSESRLISIKMRDLASILKQYSYSGKVRLRIVFTDSFGKTYSGKWKIDLKQNF